MLLLKVKQENRMWSELIKEAQMLKKNAYHMVACNRAREYNDLKFQQGSEAVRKSLQRTRLPRINTSPLPNLARTKSTASEMFDFPPLSATPLKSVSNRSVLSPFRTSSLGRSDDMYSRTSMRSQTSGIMNSSDVIDASPQYNAWARSIRPK